MASSSGQTRPRTAGDSSVPGGIPATPRPLRGLQRGGVSSQGRAENSLRFSRTWVQTPRRQGTPLPELSSPTCERAGGACAQTPRPAPRPLPCPIADPSPDPSPETGTAHSTFSRPALGTQLRDSGRGRRAGQSGERRPCPLLPVARRGPAGPSGGPPARALRTGGAVSLHPARHASRRTSPVCLVGRESRPS